MSAIAMFVGLTLATTAAVVVVLSIANVQLSANESTQLNGNQTSEEWVDPGGPSVQFVLFTRNFQPVNLKIGRNGEFSQSGFNKSHPTKIIVHGFLSSIRENIFNVIKNAYLETGDYNVIGMDWSVLCEFEYLSAMRGVRIAGYYLSEFLNWINNTGVPLDDVHLVGHSMGAHVVGIGGGSVKNGKIARITGLDPARPGYRDNRYENKLDTGDARLVDVVHTHMQVLSLSEPVGHIDFYPNGGRFQPGCPDLNDVWRIPESLLCNHGRAYYLFAESIINKKAFKSKKCTSVQEALTAGCQEDTNVYMGQENTYREGIYFFETRDTSPYSLS